MKIDILTLFPDMFAPLEHSIVGKAQEKVSWKLTIIISVRMQKRLVMWMMNPTVADKACYFVLNLFLIPLTSCR